MSIFNEYWYEHVPVSLCIMCGSGEGVNVSSLGNPVENTTKFLDLGLVTMAPNLLLERKSWWVDQESNPLDQRQVLYH